MCNAVFDLSFPDIFNFRFVLHGFEQNLRISGLDLFHMLRNIVIESIIQAVRIQQKRLPVAGLF